MNILFFLFLLLLTRVDSPVYPHKAELVSSASEILSNESFSVKYTLSGVPDNYYYVSVRDDNFEFLGPDRWEGRITSNESKVISFRLRLREDRKTHLREVVSVVAGFSLRPFGKPKTFGPKKMINIKIKDYAAIRKLIQQKERKNIDGNRSSESDEGDEIPVEDFWLGSPVKMIDSITVKGDSLN